MKKFVHIPILIIMLSIIGLETSHANTDTLNCEANFAYEVLDADSGKVQFYNTSNIETDSLTWSFGGFDNYIYGEQNPVYYFDTSIDSIFKVCLNIFSEDGVCYDQACKNILISDDPSDCQAIFSFSRTDNTVYFENRSITDSGSVTYHWNFGDGHSSQNFNPSHAYDISSDEIFEVCLTVTSDSCETIYCDSVLVTYNEPVSCVVDFNHEVLDADSGKVQFFNNSSSNADSLVWYMDDENTFIVNEENPVYYYNPEWRTTYEVCLTAYCQDSLGGLIEKVSCDTVNLSDTVPEPPQEECKAQFSYEIEPHLAEPIIVQFESNSTGDIDAYEWDFGPGGTSNEENPRVFFTSNPEEVTVCLAVYDSQSNCADTICRTIPLQDTVPGNECNAQFSYEVEERNTIEGTIVQFTDHSSGNINNWHWDFGTGGDMLTNVQNPKGYFSPQLENTTVCLIVFDSTNTCSDTICKTVWLQDTTAVRHSISGKVKANDGLLLDNGFILLYRDETNGFVAYDAGVINGGTYELTGVQEGEYILQAIPNVTSTLKYFPTYYVNKVSWVAAQRLDVSSDLYDVDITLKELLLQNPTGPGSIKGTLINTLKSTNNNFNIPIVLTSAEGYELTYTVADAQGNFEFEGLNYGTYYVYPEVPNAGESTHMKIELTTGSPNAEGITIEYNGQVLSTGSPGRDAFTLRYADNNRVIVSNPEQQYSNDIMVYNTIGQNVTNRVNMIHHGYKTEINIAGLIKGVYLVKINNQKEIKSLKFIKQ